MYYVKIHVWRTGMKFTPCGRDKAKVRAVSVLALHEVTCISCLKYFERP